MIYLPTATRVRLRRGRSVHSIRQPVIRMRQTGCSKFVHFFGLRGEPLDEPLPDATPITCRGCLAAEPEKASNA
ncbi:hypothetical protein B0E38_04743 [Streptomyces sp. 111WW2]|uniref:hypothetical protein n=1 Tax=Streptomyces sp. 111WW2 TaxID=1945515 RepID=UPI000D0C764D|nr:hypothetical protein [Streptomyces sp. 111WW2]PSK52417.1 hypothetical protein B0E38_04743 [Streptomyces sp. 111WW2]